VKKNLGIKKTVEVGSYSSNPWGFFEMHGNVWEWTADCHGAYPRSSVIDPPGPSNGSSRVLRGGSWDNNGHTSLRSAHRGTSNPSYRRNNIGFRVALKQVD
jgi:formylglycine-generating enzyme required for sulfatase activity